MYVGNVIACLGVLRFLSVSLSNSLLNSIIMTSYSTKINENIPGARMMYDD